jgi:alkylhydroperoxidase/carboxymuconolactone decarboxylase family protein YurZ
MIINIKTTEARIDLREAYDDIEAIWTTKKLNRNEQALIAIGVLIAYGVDRKRPICGAMKRLGFKPSHAAMVLTKSAGNESEYHHWKCNSDGSYSLFDAAKAA